MKYIEAGGRNIFYASSAEAGSAGTPVLFVHGAGGSYYAWLNQLKPEMPGYYQLAFDLPGHARSGGSGAQSVEDYCNFIYEFIKRAGFDKIVLAGHSMGGAVAQVFALRHSKVLEGLILIGTGARLRVTDFVLENAKNGINMTEYAYSAKTGSELIREAESEFELTSPAVRYDDFLACDKFDIMQDVGKIRTKTLIICGEEDQMTPPKYSLYLRDNISGSALKLIPEAGHMVMWEQPESVNSAIGAFLKALNNS